MAKAKTTIDMLTAEELEKAQEIIDELGHKIISDDDVKYPTYGKGFYVKVGKPKLREVTYTSWGSHTSTAKYAFFTADEIYVFIFGPCGAKVFPATKEEIKDCSSPIGKTYGYNGCAGYEFDIETYLKKYHADIVEEHPALSMSYSSSFYTLFDSKSKPYLDNLDSSYSIKLNFGEESMVDKKTPEAIFSSQLNYYGYGKHITACKENGDTLINSYGQLLLTEIKSKTDSIALSKNNMVITFNENEKSFNVNYQIESVSVLSLAEPSFNFRKYRNTYRRLESSVENFKLATKGDLTNSVKFNTMYGNDTIWDFLNTDICRKIGLFDFSLWGMKKNGDPVKVLVTLLQLMADNKILESLIKQGQRALINSILNDILCSQNRVTRTENMKNVSNLFYVDEKGNQQFRIPKYISDFLNYTGVEYSDYPAWADFAEQAKMDKNQFEKFTKTAECNLMINIIPINIVASTLAYDVPLMKYLRYMKKNLGSSRYAYTTVPRNYLDYCEMCVKKIGKDFNRFPSNFEKAHEEVSKMKSSAVSGKYDIAIKELADKYQTTFSSDDYVIVMPQCEDDVLAEAIAQNNCLADYVERIGKQETIIFFIRKKEDVNSSFVTAQVDFNGNLVQIRRRNELPVTDKKVLDFAQMFCRHVKIKANKL